MRKAYRSTFLSTRDGSVLDDGLVLLFRGPSSFTGEDVVELHGHGGVAQARALLEAVLSAGCEAAGPGDFTRRAVRYGRLDLARAEGIAELVAAETEAGLRAGRSLLGGALSDRIDDFLGRMENLIAECEAVIDFPDESEGVDETTWSSVLKSMKKELEILADTWRDAERLRKGPRVVLIGPPNTGKSSLLNAIAEFERVIVDESPGTTRDLVEIDVALHGRVVTIVDGAGLRAEGGRVESAGMRRIENAARKADLVVGVLDASRLPQETERTALRVLGAMDRPVLMVGNKTDLGAAGLKEMRSLMKGPAWLRTCALTNEGVDDLVRCILERIERGASCEGQVVVTIERHHQALLATVRALEKAGSLLNEGDRPVELVCEELREARASLSEIVGRGNITETLLDRVFERFCIGK